MINLLPKKNQEDNGIKKIGHLVKVLTTIVLVVYVVSGAGFLGWTFYQSAKTIRVSAELEKLNSDVSAKAVEEVVVRKLAAKSMEIDDFLSSRPNVVKMADLLISSGSLITHWNFDSVSGMQRIQTSASSSAQINELAAFLSENYKLVKLERLSFTQNEGWIGVVSAGGGFKQ